MGISDHLYSTYVQSGLTSLSTGVPDSSECPQNQRHCGSREASDVFNIVDNTGLVPEEQTIHNAISASFAPDEMRPHDTAHASSDAEYFMTEDLSPSGACDTGVNGVDELPAQDTDLDIVEQQGKDELEPHVPAPDLGSESMAPSPLCGTPLSPESSPAKMPVVSTRVVPQPVDLNHELEALASCSIANGRQDIASEAVTTVTGQSLNVSSTDQSERAMDEKTKGDVSRGAPSFAGRSPQLLITTNSSLLSTDEDSHLSPQPTKSTTHDMTLMTVLETVASSSITSKQITQISTAERVIQEPSSNVSSVALPARQNVPSMCNP